MSFYHVFKSNGLTRPIPAAALPVVDRLRAEVSKPETLPLNGILTRGSYGGKSLRWYLGGLKGGRGSGCLCPMGLHPMATCGMPFNEWEFPALVEAIKSFAMWFDEQVSAQQTLDAIWGES